MPGIPDDPPLPGNAGFPFDRWYSHRQRYSKSLAMPESLSNFQKQIRYSVLVPLNLRCDRVVQEAPDRLTKPLVVDLFVNAFFNQKKQCHIDFLPNRTIMGKAKTILLILERQASNFDFAPA